MTGIEARRAARRTTDLVQDFLIAADELRERLEAERAGVEEHRPGGWEDRLHLLDRTLERVVTEVEADVLSREWDL